MKKILISLMILSLNVNAKSIEIPKKEITNHDTIISIMNNSNWLYDIQTRELKFCFYITEVDKVCSHAPRKFIIIRKNDGHSI